MSLKAFRAKEETGQKLWKRYSHIRHDVISSHGDEKEDRRPNSQDLTRDGISHRRREKDSDDDEEVASDSSNEYLNEGRREVLGDSVFDYRGVVRLFVKYSRCLRKRQSVQRKTERREGTRTWRGADCQMRSRRKDCATRTHLSEKSCNYERSSEIAHRHDDNVRKIRPPRDRPSHHRNKHNSCAIEISLRNVRRRKVERTQITGHQITPNQHTERDTRWEDQSEHDLDDTTGIRNHVRFGSAFVRREKR